MVKKKIDGIIEKYRWFILGSFFVVIILFSISFISSTFGYNNRDLIVLRDGSLNDLTDVSVPSPANAQVLAYNSTSGEWENTNAQAVGDTNETTRFDNLVGTNCSAGDFIFGHQTDGTVACDTPSGVANSSWNETHANTLYYLIGNPYSYYNSTNPQPGANSSWNESYADTLYYDIANPYTYWNSTFALFNKTYADTLYYNISNIFSFYNSTTLANLSQLNDDLGHIEDNSSWNQTHANTLYAVIGSGNSSWNETHANTLYYLISNPYTYWNDTFATFNKSFADTIYLNLSGTNADQNINIGNFNFTTNYISGKTLDPSVHDDLVNKNYVDDVTSATAFDFFLTNSTSDISGHFNLTEISGDVQSTLTTPSLGIGNFSVFNWTTLIGQPEFSELRQGVYDVHLHLSHTGTRLVTIIPRLYNVSSNGSNRNLLITFESSEEITSSVIEYNLHGVLSDPVTLGTGERLSLELEAIVSGGGSNVVISSVQEGLTDSHLTVETSTNAFERIFIRRDGTNNLTGNWNQGAFNLTNTLSWFLGSINASNVRNAPWLNTSSDTNASTACSGTTTYLDGENNCDVLNSLSNFSDNLGHVEDNSSWNQTHADTLYAVIGSGNSSWNQTHADTLYVNVNGDTMTGNLNMSGNDITEISNINPGTGSNVTINPFSTGDILSQNYDLVIGGDEAGAMRLGNARIGSGGNITVADADFNGTFLLLLNGNVTSDFEFVLGRMEETIRFAIPRPATDFAMQTVRSVMVGGNDADSFNNTIINCTAQGYRFIDCATDITGADIGIQDDIEFWGSLFGGNGTWNATDDGNITASFYFGDGSQLSNLPSGGNSSWNETHANTLYYLIGNPYSYYNSTTLANLSQLNDDLGHVEDNSSWNQTHANTLYAVIGSGNSSWNETHANTLYYGLSNPFTYWNSTFALFNETYADTLYSPITEPLWTGNQSNVAFTNIEETFSGNVTVEGIKLEVDVANHRMYDNATCVIITGDTATFNIC